MNSRSNIRLGLLAATILGSTAPIAAYADDAPAPDTTAPAPPTVDNGQVIVVTATRRSVSLQDVPINISAVSGQALADQRIDNVRDLAAFTPGLTIKDTGPSSTGTIIMRGLSADDTSSSGDNFNNALAIYLGETPLYADLKFMDIARVETLLGPQGTLYGEGTLAGAIRYLPNRPNPDKWSGSADMRFFGESHAHAPGANIEATVNIPLIMGKLALRSSVGYWDNPGFIDYVGLVNTPGVSNPQPGGLVGNDGQGVGTLRADSQTDVIGVDPTTGAAPAQWYVNNATPAEIAANLHNAQGVNFESTLSMRHSLGFFPTDWLKVFLNWTHQFTDTNGDQINSGGVLGTGLYEASKRYLEPTHRMTDLYSIEVEAEVGGFAQLVSDTAWTKQTVQHQGDNTDLLLDLNYGYEAFPQFTSYNKSQSSRTQFNQELRLVSKAKGLVSWTIGGFYNRMNLARNYHEVVPGFPAWAGIYRPDEWEYASFLRSSNEEKAGYGELTLNFSDKWQVTGGIRRFSYTAFVNGGSDLPLYDTYPEVNYSSVTAQTSKAGTVWKGNTSYKFSSALMAYFTWTKGYRLGGANQVVPCKLPLDPTKQNLCALPSEQIFGPDTTNNKELGVRFSLFGGKLRGSLAGYYIDWNGIQLGSVTQNGAIGITVNGGKAISKGVELNFVARPIDHLSITGSYAYNDAHLTQDVPGLIHISNGGKLQVDAKSGDRLPGSAKHSGSLGVDYEIPVGLNAIDMDWTVTYNGDVMTRPGDEGYGQLLPAYTTHRGFISYKFKDEGFELKLYGDNIFDKYAVTGVSNNLSNRVINSGVISRYYSQSVLTPRRVGIELSKTF